MGAKRWAGVLVASLVCWPVDGWTDVEIGGETVRIGNSFLARHFSLADGRVRTVRVVNRISGDELEVDADELLVRTGDGRELTARDLALAGEPTVRREDAADHLVFRLQSQAAGLGIEVRFVLGHRDAFMRKRLAVRGLGDASPVVTDVEIERFRTDRQTDLGGFGQPLFIPGDWFLGLEYPAGNNECREGLVTLRHHPGRRAEETPWLTKRAVWGVAPRGEVERGFARYVAGMRRKPRSFTVYNSWYDVRRGDLTAAVLLPKLRLFNQKGVDLHSFVLDDGWQEPKSIWKPEARQYPGGFGPLAEELRGLETDLGLWMPLTAISSNLDLEWGAGEGYETSPDRRFYCLSGQRYNDAVRGALRQFITADGVNYFKHDFNVFSCTGNGHGHLTGRVYGTEANVDAEIAMFRFMRGLREDLYINPSGGMWLSPWWLQHVDTVWMRHCRDYGLETRVPAFTRRDFAMTYRDSMLWTNLRKDRCQFPVSAVMTIGVIYGKRNMLGGKDESLRTWADNVVLNFGRGTMLKELYLTPELLSDEQWRVLRESLAWAEANQEVLAEGGMILGSPAAGEVYGYAHAAEGRLIVCLRNPSVKPQKAAIPLSGLPRAGTYLAMVVYPYREVLSSGLRVGDPLGIELEGTGLAVVDIRPVAAVTEPVLEGCRYSVAEGKGDGTARLLLWGQEEGTARLRLHPGQASARLDPPDGSRRLEPGTWEVRFPEPMTPVSAEVSDGAAGVAGGVRAVVPERADSRLVVLVEETGLPPPPVSLQVDGEAAPLQQTTGDGWAMLWRELRPGACDVEWRADVGARADEPFSAGSFRVSVWLMAEHALASCTATVARSHRDVTFGLPTPRAGVKKQALLLAGPEDVELVSNCRRRAVSAEDLSRAKAAKLHISVFGSQGGQYADKPMLLNGVALGVLPVNGSPPDRWEERIVSVPPPALAAIRGENKFVVRNEAGDAFKVTDVALAVELGDGRWAETSHDTAVYSSTAGWLHSEGTSFRGDASPAIRLGFGSE